MKGRMRVLGAVLLAGVFALAAGRGWAATTITETITDMDTPATFLGGGYLVGMGVNDSGVVAQGTNSGSSAVGIDFENVDISTSPTSIAGVLTVFNDLSFDMENKSISIKVTDVASSGESSVAGYAYLDLTDSVAFIGSIQKNGDGGNITIDTSTVSDSLTQVIGAAFIALDSYNNMLPQKIGNPQKNSTIDLGEIKIESKSAWSAQGFGSGFIDNGEVTIKNITVTTTGSSGISAPIEFAMGVGIGKHLTGDPNGGIGIALGSSLKVAEGIAITASDSERYVLGVQIEGTVAGTLSVGTLGASSTDAIIVSGNKAARGIYLTNGGGVSGAINVDGVIRVTGNLSPPSPPETYRVDGISINGAITGTISTDGINVTNTAANGLAFGFLSEDENVGIDEEALVSLGIVKVSGGARGVGAEIQGNVSGTILAGSIEGSGGIRGIGMDIFGDVDGTIEVNSFKATTRGDGWGAMGLWIHKDIKETANITLGGAIGGGIEVTGHNTNSQAYGVLIENNDADRTSVAGTFTVNDLIKVTSVSGGTGFASGEIRDTAMVTLDEIEIDASSNTIIGSDAFSYGADIGSVSGKFKSEDITVTAGGGMGAGFRSGEIKGGAEVELAKINVTSSNASFPSLGVDIASVSGGTFTASDAITVTSAGTGLGFQSGEIKDGGIVNLNAITVEAQSATGVNITGSVAGTFTAGDAITVTSAGTGLGFQSGEIKDGAAVTLGEIDVTAQTLASGVYIPTGSVAADTLKLDGDISVAVSDSTGGNAIGILANELKNLDIAHSIKAESAGGNAAGIMAENGNNTINVNADITAESKGSGIAYGIMTESGSTSTVNILADVKIAATTAGGTATDISLNGAADTLNFKADSYNRKIVVSGAENVNFAGASATLQAGSSFTGINAMNFDGGPTTLQGGSTFAFGGANPTATLAANASLILQGDVEFAGAAFTANAGGVLDFGKKSDDTLATLAADAITLDQDVSIRIAAGISDNGGSPYEFLKAATSFGVGGDPDAFLARLRDGFKGSASQDWTFSMDADSLDLAITDLAAPSTGNIVKNLDSLGIRRANDVVTGSFAQALFDFTKSGTIVDSNGSVIGDIVQDAMHLLAGNPSPNGAVAALGGREGDAVARVLSGASDAVVTGIFNHTAFAGQRLISARLGNVRTALNQARSLASSDALASAILNANYLNRFWVSGLGLWEDADPRGGDLGYEVDSGGFMTGYDRAFGSVVAGGSFGYTRGSFKDKAALDNDSDIDSYSFNLYATLNHCSGFFAGVMAGYMYSDFDMKRVVRNSVARDEGKYHANTWSLGSQVGYDWKPAENLTLTPSLGLTYLNSRTGRIANTYTTINRLREDAVQMPLDLEVRYDLAAGPGNVISLKANAGYAYNFKNDGAEGVLSYNGIVDSPRVNIQGRTPGRHTLNLGAGAKATFGRFEAGLEYDYHAKKDYDAHRLMGTFGVSF